MKGRLSSKKTESAAKSKEDAPKAKTQVAAAEPDSEDDEDHKAALRNGIGLSEDNMNS